MKDLGRPVWAAAAVAVAVATVYWVLSYFFSAARSAAFESQVIGFRDEAGSLVATYERGIEGVKSLFDGDRYSPASWDAYFESLDLSKYPGLASVSFSARVTAADRASFERQHRLRIFPDQLKPEYFPIVNLSPLAGFEKYIGFDTSSIKPDQYRWVELARDSGHKQRTNAYYFTAAPDTYGLFIAMPIYDHRIPLRTVAERRRAYSGLVTASFRIPELLPALLAGSHAGLFDDIEIYDGSQKGASLLYDRNPSRASSAYPYSRTVEVTMANRPLVFKLGSAGGQLGPGLSPWWLLLSPLIGGLVYSRLRRRTGGE